MKEAFGDDVVVKELSSVTTTGGQANLYFTAVNSIQANTPYIMQTQQNGTEYTFENIDVKPSDILTVEVGGVQFVGNYVKDHVMANDGGEDYYILTDVFKHSTGKTKIKGLRAYFHIPAAASSPPPHPTTSLPSVPTSTATARPRASAKCRMKNSE